MSARLLFNFLHSPRFLAALLVLTAALPHAAAQSPAEISAVLGGLRGAASAPASAASDASPSPANTKLLQQASRATIKDDERILADVAARLARNPAFAQVTPSVLAGVVRLAGSVTDNTARQLAAKVASSIQGVVAVENDLVLAANLHTRLAETWEQIKDRGSRLVAAVPLLLLALAVVVLANALGKWIAARLQWGRLNSRNPYLGTLIRRTVRTAFVIAGLLIALDLLEATALVTAVLGSAGVVGIVLGFAFRDMAENYLSGIMLSLRRPFEPGDYVRIDSQEGRVVALSTRNTVLMTLDGNQLSLPNAMVFKAVLLNFTHNPQRRFSFSLSVDSDADLQRAQDLGVATLAALQGVLTDPAPSASIDAVDDSAVTVSYFAWIDQRQTGFIKARSEAIRLVKQALEKAGMDSPTRAYRVQLLPSGPVEGERGGAKTPTHVDPHALARTQADVSPDDELDDQIARERVRKADEDMLKSPPAPDAKP